MTLPADPDLDGAWIERVRAKLVAWYHAGHRDLPWRREREAYRILVAETMLVQTTVAAVIPYYERFLAQFPTVQRLAEAAEEEVLKAWEGLGYYRRARQLHAAARAIVAGHGGEVPRTVEALRTLPGVGRYIAGAVASFAFDQPAPILEANSQRVLARWLGWEGELETQQSQARLWQGAERLVPAEGAGLLNQAFMELGAVVCTPSAPTCLVCPVSAECRARALGRQDELPRRRPRRPPLEAREACALVVRGGKILIVRRAPAGLWAGFWEFPTVHLAGADPAGRAFPEPIGLAEAVRGLTGIESEIGPVVQELKYTVTKHRVRLSAHVARGLGGRPQPGPGLDRVEWVDAEALAAYPLGSPWRRLARWVGQQPIEERINEMFGTSAHRR